MRKVAIYARVSTEHEAQLSALENQVQYYDSILAMHPDWELVDKYIDEGITGTSVKKRKSFLRMLQDAEKGLFDLIVTREVSRFARNTVDTLQETRKLKRLGVEVYFTEDNIWTMNDEDGELRLTIMATLAQNESKKTSLRVKAGQMVSFQNAVPYGNGNILGYDKVGKEMVINPEQAETVKMIFDLFLQGLGEKAIQYELEKRERKTSSGTTKWFCSYIGRVLRNPFYCGTIVYRKQYVPDFLEQKKINNHGDVDTISVEGRHEPIVSKEDFALVQEKLKLHRIVRIGEDGTEKGVARPKVEGMTIWSKLLSCQCGSHFQRMKWNNSKTKERKYAYQCYSSIKTGSVATRMKKGLSTEGICTTSIVPQWKLELAFEKVFEQIDVNMDSVKEKAFDMLESCLEHESNDDEIVIREIEDKIKKQERKNENLVELRLNDEISPELFKEKKAQIEKEIYNLNSKLEALKIKNNIVSEEDKKNRLLALQIAVKRIIQNKEYLKNDSFIEILLKKIIICDEKFVFIMNDFVDKDISFEVENKNLKKCRDNKSVDVKSPDLEMPHRLLLQRCN